MKSLTLIVMCAVLSGCGAAIVGGSAVVLADEAAERERGGDGLF